MKVPFDQQILIFVDHWPITNTTPGLVVCLTVTVRSLAADFQCLLGYLPKHWLIASADQWLVSWLRTSGLWLMQIQHVTCIFQRQREKRIWNVFNNISIFISCRSALQLVFRFHIVYIYSLFCRINVKTEYCDWDPILNTFYPRPFISQYPKCFLCWTSSE